MPYQLQFAQQRPRKISSRFARRKLLQLYHDTVARLIDDAEENRDVLRHAMPHENPHPYMRGLVRGEGRFVGFHDVRQAARNARDGRRFMHFRFRGKAKKTRTLGKRKRK